VAAETIAQPLGFTLAMRKAPVGTTVSRMLHSRGARSFLSASR